MVEESWNIQTMKSMKVTSSREWSMEKESITIWKESYTLEIIFKTKNMEVVNIFTKMEIFIQVSSKIISNMEKVELNRKTITTIKVSKDPYLG